MPQTLYALLYAWRTHRHERSDEEKRPRSNDETTRSNETIHSYGLSTRIHVYTYLHHDFKLVVN